MQILIMFETYFEFQQNKTSTMFRGGPQTLTILRLCGLEPCNGGSWFMWSELHLSRDQIVVRHLSAISKAADLPDPITLSETFVCLSLSAINFRMTYQYGFESGAISTILIEPIYICSTDRQWFQLPIKIMYRFICSCTRLYSKITCTEASICTFVYFTIS